MLNYIWASLLLVGLLVAGLMGRYTGQGDVVSLALSASKSAVLDIALPLAGLMMFWLGVMRLMEKARLLELGARLVSPVMRRLFPDVPRDHPAMSAMIMNLASNMLGLGNSATPLGLKAMGHLQELNPRKDTASNAMVTFLAMNTAAFTLLPSSSISYLSAAGVKNAHQVIVPTILATACTTLTAIFMARFLERLPGFRVGNDDTPPAPEGQEGVAATPTTGDAAAGPDKPVPMTPRARWLLGTVLVLFAACAALEFAPASARATVLESTGLSQVVETAKARAEAAKAAAASAPAAATTAAAQATAPAGGWEWRQVMNSASGVAIPLLLVLAVGVALARGVKVYEEFVEGAKEGFQVATRIMPFLVAMLAALAIFRGSGALLLLEHVLSPVLALLGFPVEMLPLAMMRPLSGSGSLGLLNELLLRPELSDTLKYTAAIMYGSTETTFYVIAVYFGSVGVRRIRHALVAGLCADAVGLTMSVVFGRLMFG